MSSGKEVISVFSKIEGYQVGKKYLSMLRTFPPNFLDLVFHKILVYVITLIPKGNLSKYNLWKKKSTFLLLAQFWTLKFLAEFIDY